MIIINAVDKEKNNEKLIYFDRWYCLHYFLNFYINNLMNTPIFIVFTKISFTRSISLNDYIS